MAADTAVATVEEGEGDAGGDGEDSFEPPDEDNVFLAGSLSKRFGFFLASFRSLFFVGRYPSLRDNYFHK